MLAKKTSQIGEVEASKYKCGGIYLTIKKWYLGNVFDCQIWIAKYKTERGSWVSFLDWRKYSIIIDEETTVRITRVNYQDFLSFI